MKRSILALAASLLAILVALIVHWSEKPKDLGMDTPNGIPPSQRHLLVDHLVETPQMEVSPDTTEKAVSPEIIQTEPSKWDFVTVKARITQNGQPLSGAWMVAQPITIRPDTGHRDTDTLSLFDFLTMGHDRQSDQDGNISLNARYRVDTAENAVFGVAVFHSERGTAYDEISIHDLVAGEVLELEPDLGEILVGNVIGANGEPIPNAVVHISTETPHEGVCLSGLGARTMPDGSFMIPGFGFENKLRSIHATAHREEYNSAGDEFIEEFGSTERIVDHETDFSAQENAWTIGTISVATQKVVKWTRDLNTGQITMAMPPLPSDE